MRLLRHQPALLAVLAGTALLVLSSPSRAQSYGFGGYTASRRPVVLVWQQDFQRITDAIAAERRLKGWSRAKKEALIRGEHALLPILASLAANQMERPSRRAPAERSSG